MRAFARVVLLCVFVLCAGGCSFLFEDEEDCCCADDDRWQGALQTRGSGFIGRAGSPSRTGAAIGRRR